MKATITTRIMKVSPDGSVAYDESASVDLGDVTGLAPHQVRVIGEKAELDHKREKLKEFIYSPFFTRLDAEERNRLSLQLVCMDDYSAVLGARIRNFLPPEVLS